MFSTILEEADEETASCMVPVILERVGLLYPVQDYRKEIHEYDILISTQTEIIKIGEKLTIKRTFQSLWDHFQV